MASSSRCRPRPAPREPTTCGLPGLGPARPAQPRSLLLLVSNMLLSTLGGPQHCTTAPPLMSRASGMSAPSRGRLRRRSAALGDRQTWQAKVGWAVG